MKVRSYAYTPLPMGPIVESGEKIHWTSKIISVSAALNGRCSVCP